IRSRLMTRYLILLMAFSFFATGCDSMSDQERMQGEWQLAEMSGSFRFNLPPTKWRPTTLTFAGNSFTYKNGQDPTQSVSGTFSHDASKNPKEITFTWGKQSVVGIYSLSRNSLQICVGHNDGMPPRTFAGGPGERPALLSFRRPASR